MNHTTGHYHSRQWDPVREGCLLSSQPESVYTPSCSHNKTAQTAWVQRLGTQAPECRCHRGYYPRTHHLHAMLSPGAVWKLLPLLVPSTLPQEITVPGGVMKGSPVYPAVAVLPRVQHGDKVQPWETTPLPANPKHPTLISPPCATWLTRRLSLLPHRLADIQEGAFDPAVRKNAWWYQVYVCTCNRRFSKVLGTKVLLSFTVTQDLGTKMRDLCWKAMEMVIFIWEDFQLQWLQAALRAALMAVQIHHFQGILPALWNATLQNFVSLKLLTHQECDCGTLSWS